jgi:hypothetical protein
MGNTARSKQYIKRKRVESLKNTLYGKYRYRARSRNIVFLITKEEFLNVAVQDCYLCGEKPKCKLSDYQYKSGCYFVYNSVDRVDNSLGYISGNIMPCCKKCNAMKSALSEDDFKSHIKRIAKHIAGRLCVFKRVRS